VRGRLSCLVRVHHPLGTDGNGTELRTCVGTTIALGPWGGGVIGSGPPAQALTGGGGGGASAASPLSSPSPSTGGGGRRPTSGAKPQVSGLGTAPGGGKGGKGRATAAGGAGAGGAGAGGAGAGGGASAPSLSAEQAAQFAQLSANEKRDPLSATLVVSEAVLEAELAKPDLEEMRRMTLDTQMYTLKVAVSVEL